MIEPDHPTTRQTIDRWVSSLAFLLPAQDSFLLYYKMKYDSDFPFAPVLRYVESVYGLGIIVAVSVSIGYQANEDCPTGLDADLWRTMMALKFLQNFTSGTVSLLAFTQAPPLADDPKIKLAGVAARGTGLTLRSLFNTARAGIQLHERIADYDGPV